VAADLTPWTLCGECDRGILWGPGPQCTCAPGPELPGQHHPYCGAQPCPHGCWDKLRAGEDNPFCPDPSLCASGPQPHPRDTACHLRAREADQ
jgi:hypothetical protein